MHPIRQSSIAAIALAFTLLATGPSLAANGEMKTITGEVMDTWCYTSQIMGPSNFVIGSAHHTCAVWCAAGGIPVGLLDQQDGTVYMIMSLGEDATSVANEQLLNLQSRVITVEGTTYNLDGINYIMVDNVVEDQGVTNLTHKIVGVLPGEAYQQ